jgi:hypothetical protein
MRPGTRAHDTARKYGAELSTEQRCIRRCLG